jgi:hypothetical protein
MQGLPFIFFIFLGVFVTREHILCINLGAMQYCVLVQQFATLQTPAVSHAVVPWLNPLRVR